MMQILKFLLKHGFHQSTFLPFYQMSLDHKLHFDHKKKPSISTHNLFAYCTYVQAYYTHVLKFLLKHAFHQSTFLPFHQMSLDHKPRLDHTHIHIHTHTKREKKYAFVTSCGLNRLWNRGE